jgi:predicted ester cyclase
MRSELEEGAAMTSHADIVRAFYDAINRGDLDELDHFTDPGYVNHQLPLDLPSDVEGTKELFSALRHAFPDLHFTVEEVVVDGDLAAAWVRMTGTHFQEFMALEPSYNQIDVRGADFVRFDQDKAVEHWGVFDRLTMLQQIKGHSSNPRAGIEPQQAGQTPLNVSPHLLRTCFSWAQAAWLGCHGRRPFPGASRRAMRPTMAHLTIASACWGSRS